MINQGYWRTCDTFYVWKLFLALPIFLKHNYILNLITILHTYLVFLKGIPWGLVVGHTETFYLDFLVYNVFVVS